MALMISIVKHGKCFVNELDIVYKSVFNHEYQSCLHTNSDYT